VKRLIFGIGLMLTASAVFAQSENHAGQGYMFFAPGVSNGGGGSFLHFGGGGEALVKNVGLGGEIGYATPWSSFADGLGIMSLNGSYNFGNRRVTPFATGGYSLFFRSGTASGFNFGGGINYWLTNRTGLRFEVRDNVLPSGDAHLVGFRVGVSFR
jgi:hypothetical protein